MVENVNAIKHQNTIVLGIIQTQDKYCPSPEDFIAN